MEYFWPFWMKTLFPACCTTECVTCMFRIDHWVCFRFKHSTNWFARGKLGYWIDRKGKDPVASYRQLNGITV